MKYFKIILIFILLIWWMSSCLSKKMQEKEPVIITQQEVEKAKEELGIIWEDTSWKQNQEAKIITISAKNWEFEQKEIRVKKWKKITLKINNTDWLHGIAIPDMKVVEDNEIILDTSKTWEFEFVCANYCGDGHRSMKWKIIIE